MSALAEGLNLPQENLITPDTVRRLCWEPPERLEADAVAEALAGYGARPWQIEQVTAALTTALATTPPPEPEPEPAD